MLLLAPLPPLVDGVISIERVVRGLFRGVGDPERLTLSSSDVCCIMLPSYSAREKIHDKFENIEQW